MLLIKMTEPIHSGKLIVITGPMFSGKCMSKGTEILMYDGRIKKIEDVIVGDLLMGDDSTSRTVLSTTNGFGHLHKVSPSFGEPYIVNDQHILSLKCCYSMQQKYVHGTTIDIPIQEFINRSQIFKSYYKGYHVGVDFSSQSVPLDSYILGVWLGADTSHTTEIATTDTEILSETFGLNFIQSNMSPAQFILKGSSRKINVLIDLDVIDNKHIPHTYLSNSKENRLQLLAGLLDTNGYLDNKCHRYEITQENGSLAKQIVHLARSLGMASYVHATEKSCMYKGDKRTGTYYMIHISGSCLHEIPCRIECKRAPPHTNEDALLVDLIIHPNGEGDYYGFTLNGNGRFLLGDFTVTHNSSELQRQVKRMDLAGKKCLIIKHASDTRYGKDNECCTHDMKTMPALPVKNLWTIREKCVEFDVIALDEAQFFPEIVEFVDALVETMGKIVIVAALDGTYEGKPFGRIAELLPRSEQFVKLTAVCRNCGNDAPFTVRRPDFTDRQGIVEVIGAADLYESVCRNCRGKRGIK